MTKTRPENGTLIAWDGNSILVNTNDEAWRGTEGATQGQYTEWRRACEGETSRDGLWVVGGSQWRYGC